MRTGILIYTFYNWYRLTYRLQRQLDQPNLYKMYIRGLRGSNLLVNHILKHRYSHILGLADYRKNATKIRIEGKFINRFGRGKILAAGPDYYLPRWNLQPIQDSYLADKASFSSCNRSAYLLSHAIKQSHLPTKLAFVHIPKTYDFEQAQKTLETWLALSDRSPDS